MGGHGRLSPSCNAFIWTVREARKTYYPKDNVLGNNNKVSVCSKGISNETFKFKFRTYVATLVCLVLSYVCDDQRLP